MECKVDKILPLGDKGGAGNLIFCNIVLMHIAEEVLNEKGRIDPHKIDLVARMGRFYYARASGDAIFEVVQEVTAIGMGFDGLPPGIRHSNILTGNNLGQLAALPALPSKEDAMALAVTDERVQKMLKSSSAKLELHAYAKAALERNEVELGAKLVVLGESL